MPKIIQINVCANWGSTGRIAEHINQHLYQKGWDIYFAYGRSVNPSQSKLIHLGNKFSQALALIQARLFDNDGLASYFATKTFIKKIKEISPDIIHIHNLHGYYINYRVLFDFLNNTEIPVVWTLHDCWSFTGHCSHFISIGCEKWRNGCFHCPLKNDYPSSLLLDRSAYNYKLKKELFSSNKNLHLVVVSNWLKDLVADSFLGRCEVSVINNGVDLELFKPTQRLSNKQKFRIIGLASVWTKSKGLFDFFKIRELLDASQYEIVLIGLSKEQVKDLPEGIIGIERTNSQQELVNYYNSADVFVNPTTADTFPTTNIEALACGVPVITYMAGGSPEILSDDTGFVVAKGNVEEMAHCIQTICERQDGLMKEKCRNRAELLYSVEMQYKSYLDLYKRILGRR